MFIFTVNSLCSKQGLGCCPAPSQVVPALSRAGTQARLRPHRELSPHPPEWESSCQQRAWIQRAGEKRNCSGRICVKENPATSKVVLPLRDESAALPLLSREGMSTDERCRGRCSLHLSAGLGRDKPSWDRAARTGRALIAAQHPREQQGSSWGLSPGLGDRLLVPSMQ